MTIEDAIEVAIERTKRADLAGAEQIYASILAQHPGNKIASFLHDQLKGASEAATSGNFPQKQVLGSFRSQPSPYFAIPPYNANWALTDLTPIADFLQGNPLNIVDVGARDAYLGEIENLKQFCNYYGFDADRTECERINSQPPDGFRSLTMLPYYVGTENNPTVFHLYKSPAESSQFEPCERFRKLFDENLAIQQSFTLEARALDRVIEDARIPNIDFLKLDTQGSELNVLESGTKALDRLLLLESEIEITEMYKGQPLLGTIVSFLNSHGFDLLYLNRVFRTRRNYPGEARGQIIFCDALFAKRETNFHALDPVQLAKHAILLCNYGHLDIAFDIWNSTPDVRRLLPDLTTYFSPYKSPSDRAQIMNHEKLLYWQLARRRTNQLFMDSDRSWPIR